MFSDSSEIEDADDQLGDHEEVCACLSELYPAQQPLAFGKEGEPKLIVHTFGLEIFL